MVETIRELVEKRPIFGICLGLQLLGLALGGRTFKLKFGHHGANHPVKNLVTGRVEVTSQNHGFGLDASLFEKPGLECTHVSLNDDTIEGFRHRELPLMAVQYHPEASPGPHDSHYLFDEFRRDDARASKPMNRGRSTTATEAQRHGERLLRSGATVSPSVIPQPPLTLPLYLDSDGSSERAAARDALRSRDRGRAWGAAPSFRHEPEQLRGSEPESQGWDAATSRNRPMGGERMSKSVPTFVGIDVSKDKLDVAVRPVQEQFSASNDDTGIAELRKRLKRHRGALVVIEATGGLEHVVAAALSTSGFLRRYRESPAGAGVWSRHRSTGQDGQDRR